MACGMIALNCAGIPVNRYDAYEIDKYAILTSQTNFPNITHCGDVFDADYSVHSDVDILMGGSPCTFWSIARQSGRETVASGLGWELFSQYLRALRETTPACFIYENNKSMSRDIYQSITNSFGFEPIMINSSLVSAQMRQRYYWVGIRQPDGSYIKADIALPEDRGITLKDIVLTSNRAKSGCLRATYYKAGRRNFEENIKCGRGYEGVVERVGLMPIIDDTVKDSQSYTVENGQMLLGGTLYPMHLANGKYTIRKLTIDECKKLQTVPENYIFPVSDTQAYKMLGNGWTVEVIVHILNSLTTVLLR